MAQTHTRQCSNLVYIFGKNKPGGSIVGWTLLILAQMLVTILVTAISRYRYVVDEDSRRYTGSGDPLVRALEKSLEMKNVLTPKSITERMSSSIFDTERGFLVSFFAKPPPTEKWIERLRS